MSLKKVTISFPLIIFPFNIYVTAHNSAHLETHNKPNKTQNPVKKAEKNAGLGLKKLGIIEL